MSISSTPNDQPKSTCEGVCAKIRILHIIPNFGSGGAERLLVDLLESFDYGRFEMAAVSLYPETGMPLEQEIRKKGINVFYLSKHRGPDLKMIPRLWRLFQMYRPDVLHSHRYVLRYALLPSLKCTAHVRVHTVHNVAQKEVDQLGKLIHQVAFRSTLIKPVSISQEVAATVKKLYGHTIETPIIYNGIPTRKFTASQHRRRNNGRTILLHIGRFSPQKNHRLLIEVFSMVIKECPNIFLWLVGDGELRPAMEKIVADKGLKNRINFLGLREDVPKLLNNCDIFTLPSNWEGVPLTILEAMASGKPVVATSVGGVPELVENGISGILVRPRDAEVLAHALLRLAKDPSLCQSMGQMAQKKAIARFDIAKTAREYEALYMTLLKGCKQE